MNFTDDDLKRLKVELQELRDLETGVMFPINDVEALLARLEAAEKALAVFHDNLGLQDSYINYEKCENLFESWRKACGK
jgi:hypothetical protein